VILGEGKEKGDQKKEVGKKGQFGRQKSGEREGLLLRTSFCQEGKRGKVTRGECGKKKKTADPNFEEEDRKSR